VLKSETRKAAIRMSKSIYMSNVGITMKEETYQRLREEGLAAGIDTFGTSMKYHKTNVPGIMQLEINGIEWKNGNLQREFLREFFQELENEDVSYFYRRVSIRDHQGMILVFWGDDIEDYSNVRPVAICQRLRFSDGEYGEEVQQQ
jgi:hypothetical protein